MAGEKKGKTCEAITLIALRELKTKRRLGGSIFWNKKPSSMTIEPDFTVGPNYENPEIVLMVTHSGSTKNSNMKFWRNIGELAEAKTLLSTIPRAYSIIFDSAIFENLKKVESVAFDGQLVIGETGYGKLLLKWIDENYEKLPVDGEAKVEAIWKLISKEETLKLLINDLAADLHSLIFQHKPELDQLWGMARRRRLPQPRSAKTTYLRRGIGKLLLLQPPYSTAITRDGRFRPGTPIELLKALERIGLAKRTIGGFRASDPELLWPINNIAPDLLEKICMAQPLSQMSELIEALLSLAQIELHTKYITQHWKELTTAHGLYKHLKSCYENPGAINPNGKSSSRRVWLYHALMEWIKLAGNTRTAYGLGRLATEVDKAAADPHHRKEVAKIVGGHVEWRSSETIVRLGLVDWVSSPSAQNFPLYDDDLARVSSVLANRLQKCQQPNPLSDTEKLVDAIVQCNLETKLLPYRHFQPIESAIEIALKQHGYAIKKFPFTKACFAQFAESLGLYLDPRAAGTTVFIVKSTLINWQSAHGSHTNDKTKELCGRAVALRYSWDTETSRFTPRPSVKKLILIVDGTWRQEELNALLRAGWDEIFYPDEMEELVKAIE